MPRWRRRADDPGSRRDSYDAAADRMAARRAPGDAPPGAGEVPDGAAEPEPPDLLRAPSRRVGRKILAGALFLLFIQQIGAARKPPAPSLQADCTRASFALSTHSVKQARPLTYTIVGPDGHRFVLGVDTASFVHEPAGGWTAVPLPGADASYEVAAPVEPMKGCRRTGIFALPIPLGEHIVTLYELRDDGAVEVQRETVTVTDH